MTERPIIMSPDSVRAVLSGAKTQTRRVITRQHLIPPTTELRGFGGDFSVAGHDFRCPFGRPGEKLWVKEAWSGTRTTEAFPNPGRPMTFVAHRAAYDPKGRSRAPFGERWHGPVDMPRWASRLTLEVVSVRVERLHALTEADAKAEGYSDRANFEAAWDRLNAKRGHPWDANPWVWVVEFKRTEDER